MTPIQFSLFYHIYNCGIDHQDLFKSTENYRYFLELLKRHINPVGELYAWVLMKNHFHLLLRIKDEVAIPGYAYPGVSVQDSKIINKMKWETTQSKNNEKSSFQKKPQPILHFSHFFNSYSKYFNKLNNRSGALFERPFKRIDINSDEYLKRLVVYIHTNPIHHGFCNQCNEYPWSSYNSILSDKPTALMRKEVLDWFDNAANFIHVHHSKCEWYEEMRGMLLEED